MSCAVVCWSETEVSRSIFWTGMERARNSNALFKRIRKEDRNTQENVTWGYYFCKQIAERVFVMLESGE